jgi:hypothetical protein
MAQVKSLPMLNVLYFHISIFRSKRSVPNVAVFCSSWMSFFPGILLSYFLNDFEMLPIVLVFTGFSFVFTSHILCVSIVRSFYIAILQASFLVSLLSPEIATSINIRVPFYCHEM